MKKSADIDYAGLTIGHISFDPNKFILTHTRNSHRVTFILTPELTLKRPTDADDLPCIWGLSGRIFGTIQTSTDKLYLGELNSNGFYSAPMQNNQCEIYWHTTVQEILEFEEFRNGEIPLLEMQLYGLISKQAKIKIDNGDYYTQKMPLRYFQEFRLKVPIDYWHKTIELLNLKKYCLLEIPLSEAPKPDQIIYNSVQKAIEAFNEGGSSGWSRCVSAARIALEKINNNYPTIFRVPESKTKSELEAWSKGDRLKNIAWSLKHLSHIPHHDDDETWSRAEASLVLSCLINIYNLVLKAAI